MDLQTVERLLDGFEAHHGGHPAGSKDLCSGEFIRLRADGQHDTSAPCGLHPAAGPLWGLVVPFNDAWGADCPVERRTAGQRRLLVAILTCEWAPPEGWGYALADIAVRVWAPRALRAAGLDAEAARLEALAPIVDATTAAEAADAARAAEDAAAEAAWAAADAARAAAEAARAAAEAAWAAAADAARAAAEAAWAAWAAAEAADAARAAAWAAAAQSDASPSASWDALDLAIGEVCALIEAHRPGV